MSDWMNSSNDGRAAGSGDAGSLSAVGGVDGGVGGRHLSVRKGVGPHRMTSEAF